MGSCSAPVEPINQYALVTYLPDELGQFLDQLRRDLVADCTARSHLSILPPRPLGCCLQQAESQIESLTRRLQPVVIRLAGLAVFPQTAVIYLELAAGQAELTSLHDAFACDSFAYNEPFPFHPHITLAQNFDPATLAERQRLAESRWAAYQGPREFLLDRVVFVQNTTSNRWLDLRTFPLLAMPSAPVAAPVVPVYSNIVS
jgi:2'-5' RNA ligase